MRRLIEAIEKYLPSLTNMSKLQIGPLLTMGSEKLGRCLYFEDLNSL